MTVINFSSYAYGLKLFLLLSGIGLLFGVMAYLICRYPSMRRAQFREWGPHPVMGLVLGGCILSSFLLGAWSSSFARFYGVKIEKDGLLFTFHLPERSRWIPCADIKKAYRQVASLKSHTWELAIVLKNGKVIRSMQAPKADFDKSIEPLAGRLCPDVEISDPHF